MQDISFIPKKHANSAFSSLKETSDKKNKLALLFLLLSLVLILGSSLFGNEIKLQVLDTQARFNQAKAHLDQGAADEVLKKDLKFSVFKVLFPRHVWASKALSFLKLEIIPYLNLREASFDFSNMLEIGESPSSQKPGVFLVEGDALSYDALNTISEKLKLKSFLKNHEFSAIRRSASGINLSIKGEFSKDIFK